MWKARVRVATVLIALVFVALPVEGLQDEAAEPSTEGPIWSEDQLRALRASGVAHSDLIRALQEGDSVRVIVSFTVPGAPAGSRVAVARDPSGDPVIRSVGRSIVARLAPGDFELISEFPSLGVLAGRIGRRGLLRLVEDPHVRGIGLDPPIVPQLAEAVPFVGLTSVHDLGFTGEGVTVAVVDSGVDTDHPDIADDLVGERCFCSSFGGCCPDGSSDQSGVGSAEDDDGHGTFVSGIITSRGIVAPPGGAPDAGILAVKATTSDLDVESAISDVLLAGNWIRLERPDVAVINMSLGTPQIYESPCDDYDVTTYIGSILVEALRADGVVLLASAGNESSGTGMALPACLSGVIGVGAVYDEDFGTQTFCGIVPCCTDLTTKPDQVTCFSNSDPTTAVFAPGAHVLSPALGGGAVEVYGTSAAAPIAASCAALLKQKDPAATPLSIELALRTSPTLVTDPKNGLVFPRLNCAAALAALPVLFTVDSTVDTVDANPGDGVCADATGACTLRAAVMETNALPGADEIQVPAGTYKLGIPTESGTADAVPPIDSGTAEAVDPIDSGTVESGSPSGLLDQDKNWQEDEHNGRVVVIRPQADAQERIIIDTIARGIILWATDNPVDPPVAPGDTYSILRPEGSVLHDQDKSWQDDQHNGRIVRIRPEADAQERIIIDTIAPGIILWATDDPVDPPVAPGDTYSILWPEGSVLHDQEKNWDDDQLNQRRVRIRPEADAQERRILDTIATGTIVWATDNPVDPPVAPGDTYWIFGRYGDGVAKGDLNVLDDVALVGAGAAETILDADGIARLMHVHGNCEIRGLTITGGVTDGDGGGLYLEDGVLSVMNSRIEANSADGDGGGLYLEDGVLIMEDSVIEGNTAGYGGGLSLGCTGAGCWDYPAAFIYRSTISRNVGIGGGLLVYGSGSVTVVDSTIDYNEWGGVLAEGDTSLLNTRISGNTFAGVKAWGPVELVNSTITENDSIGIDGGSNVSLKDSIVASQQSGPDCQGGVSVTLGHNIDSDGTCGLTDPTDLPNTDPMLGPLQDNGGPTLTHALLAGSPAIDAIPEAECTWDDDGDPGTPEVPVTQDQRGVPRPQEGACDIGAVEFTDCGGSEADDGTEYPDGLLVDSDDDGFLNLCDADLDQSDLVEFLDLGILKARFFTADPDADLNSDGVVDFLDLGRMKALFFQPPQP